MERGLEAGLAGEALLVADHPRGRVDDRRVEGAAGLGGERQDRLGLRRARACRGRSAPAHASATARIRLPRGIASAGRPAGQPSPAQRSWACRARSAASEASSWLGAMSSPGARAGRRMARRCRRRRRARGARPAGRRARRRSRPSRGGSPPSGSGTRRTRPPAIRSSAACGTTITSASGASASTPIELDEDGGEHADDEHPEHRGAEVDELVADQGGRAIALVEGREGEPGEAEVDRPHGDAGRVERRGRSRAPVGEPASASSPAPTSTASAKLPTLATKPGLSRLLGAEHEAGDQVGHEPDQERGRSARRRRARRGRRSGWRRRRPGCRP